MDHFKRKVIREVYGNKFTFEQAVLFEERMHGVRLAWDALVPLLDQMSNTYSKYTRRQVDITRPASDVIENLIKDQEREFKGELLYNEEIEVDENGKELP